MGEIVKIENRDGILVVSSRVIAKQLKKKHDKVLRDLDKILIDPNVGRLILSSNYKDSKNRIYREYLLTKDGFTLYMFNIQGYNDFKMNYINEFNKMQEVLTNNKWTFAREQGKLVRKQETDAIKMLMEYGAVPKEKQRLYYMTYSKLPFVVLGIKKVERDKLNSDDLELVKELESIIQVSILTSIIKKLDVKAIYQECKKACINALVNQEQEQKVLLIS